METAALAIGVRSVLSEKSVMESCSVPSLRLSELRAWVKEKEPVRETMPDPVRSPLLKSLASIPDPPSVQ